MANSILLDETEIERFYNRFKEERRLKRPIISAIILATFDGQEKLFDVEIDTVQSILRSESIKQSVATLEGFKLLIASGFIKVFEHENLSAPTCE